MQRLPVITKDGSHTIHVPELQATYHSVNGAITESRIVFIGSGLLFRLEQPLQPPLKILEMGFGTGLNLLLSWLAMENRQQQVAYTALEPFPLEWEIARGLNYPRQLDRPDLADFFRTVHAAGPGETLALGARFSFTKKLTSLQDELKANNRYDLVYYDAFAPLCQPELWTEEIFTKLATRMNRGAVLVTYCSKGDVRRALQAAGLIVSKLPGPPGKREMLRAVKA